MCAVEFGGEPEPVLEAYLEHLDVLDFRYAQEVFQRQQVHDARVREVTVLKI